MAMTLEEIKRAAKKVVKYMDILNDPDESNTIKIKDGVVILIENGILIKSREISTDLMCLDKIEYNKNVFNSSDVKYSPFEADRKDHWSYWVKSYRHIDFPKLIPIPLIAWMFVHKWPDIIDLCKIYTCAYAEVVPESERIDRRNLFTGDYAEFKNTTKLIVYTDGRTIRNKVLRFKSICMKYVKGLPCNEFTTEQLFSRIYKAYGSCVRDPYSMIRMRELGANSEYDLYLDIKRGIDGLIEGIPYYGYSKTNASENFRNIKVTYRHIDLPTDIGVSLIKENENKNGVHLPKDEILKKVISDIRENNIIGIKKYLC